MHRSNLPIMSDFQKDLPVCSPVNQSSLDLLQGVRLMWATRSEVSLPSVALQPLSVAFTVGVILLKIQEIIRVPN